MNSSKNAPRNSQYSLAGREGFSLAKALDLVFNIFVNYVLHPKLTLVSVRLRNALQFGVVQITAEETNVRPTDPSKSVYIAIKANNPVRKYVKAVAQVRHISMS